MALLDISTGEFFVAEGAEEYIDKLLQTLRPAEVIFQRSFQKHFKEVFGTRFFTYSLEGWVFDQRYAQESLLKHFQTHSLKGFGIEKMDAAIIAAGAIIHYLKDTEHPNLQHLGTIQRIDQDNHLWMDKFTIRNLELLDFSGENKPCLLQVLDNTISPMGARLLKRWMVMPLKDVGRINERLDLVEFLIREVDLRNQLTQYIKPCGDLERLSGKIPMKRINPREILQLSRALGFIEQIKKITLEAGNDYLQKLTGLLDPCREIAGKIRTTIIENPPALIQKGGFISPGISKELDELRLIASGGKEYLVSLQQREVLNTGISSLKIGFNNVYGYYLEVTHVHKDKVPVNWMRKQTLTNAERYITPELKEYEEKIVGAEEKIHAIELQLYEELVQDLQRYLGPLQVNGNTLAIL
ncbi:MAG TPA: hypothetical protein VK628_04015, partial [Flavitalea sp.]|nr:hypothetical protein [Flavitalea sp.]